MSNYSFTDQELNDAEAFVDYLVAKYPKTSESDQPYIGISTDSVDHVEAEQIESGGDAITRLIKDWREETGYEGTIVDFLADPRMFKENTLMYASLLAERIELHREINRDQRRIGDLTVKEFKELMRSLLSQNKSSGWH